MKKLILFLIVVGISITIYFNFFKNPTINIDQEDNFNKSDFKILICSEDKKETVFYQNYIKYNFDEYVYDINLTIIYKDSIYNNVNYWLDPDDIGEKYSLNFSFIQKGNSVICDFNTQGLKRDFDHEQRIILNRKFSEHNTQAECR